MSTFFIAFEGIDGSGKTTNSLLLQKKLVELGYEVYYFQRIPSQGGWMLDAVAFSNQYMNSEDMFGKYTVSIVDALDRVRSINSFLTELLEQKEKKVIVIAEKYIWGYLAKAKQELSVEEYQSLQAIYSRVIRPNCILFLDIYEEEAFQRINQRGIGLETIAYLKKYKRAYEMLDNYDEFIKIDVNQSIEYSQAQIEMELFNIMKL